MSDETADQKTDPFRFNFHDSGEFLNWLIPTLLVGNDTQMEELHEKTDKWTNVELTIAVNGVALDPAHFLKSLEMNIDRTAQAAAARFVQDSLRLDDLVESLTDFGRAMQREIVTRARQLGVDLDDSSDY